jgi:hypothetical protein
MQLRLCFFCYLSLHTTPIQADIFFSLLTDVFPLTKCTKFGWIHNESVYFLGKVHLACRYLYSIFKFWIFKSGVHTESVYLF